MHFSLATIIACAAAFAAAHEKGHFEMKKDITCPAAGGTATFAPACHTGPPPTSLTHPHSRPTETMDHTKSKKWDGTVTVFPSGAPETTVTRGIECEGETGPSCSFIVFATPTCSPQSHHREEKTHHKTFPTVTASAGATKTVHAEHTATCKPAATTAA